MLHTSKAYEANKKKKARRILGMPVALFAVLAVLITGGVAYAAIAFTFNSSATAQADNGTTPTVSDSHFSGKFYPGVTRDLVFTVNNPNDFPVKVTAVAATGASDFSGGCANGANLSGAATQVNQNVTLATPVSVPAHDSAVVTVPNAVTLSASATAGCSFKVDYKVTGSGAGN